MKDYVNSAALQEYTTKLVAKLKTLFPGTPTAAATVADMTDHSKTYVYVGSETGYTAGDWYYWDGTAWTSGGPFQATSIITDTTLAVAGEAADAKATGDAIAAAKTAVLNAMAPAYSTSATYAVGDYVNYNGSIYRCTTAITTAESWTSGHWTAVVLGADLAAQVSDLKTQLNIGKEGKTTISGSLSYGIFENNFPVSDPRKFNAVMMQSEQYDRDITITAKTGYNFLAYWYDQSDAYVGRTANWSTSRTIPANTPFRLWIREDPLDISAVLDLDTVKYNIIFNTEQQDEIDKNTNDIELNTTNVELNGRGLQQIDAAFVWGYMNTTTGAVIDDPSYKYQVVMPTAVHYDRDVTIRCNPGYRYQVWWYSATDEYISRTGSFKTSSDEYVVTAGTYFRLFVTLDPPNNRVTVDPSVFIANVFLVTALAERVSAIADQPLFTLPEYIVNTLSYKPVGPLSKGYILLTCDDGTAGLATYTIPMLINKGVPATFGLLDTSPVIKDDTYLETVIDAIENYGCCVAQHGSEQWPTFTEKALNAYFDATETLFTSKGITEIHGAICPGGAGIDTNTLVKAIAGGRFGSVFSGGLQDELKYGNYNESGARTNQYAMTRYSAIGFTAATYQAAIDEAYENHYILCPFWHDYSVVDDTAKQAIIEGMIDYAKTKGLTFITMKDLPSIT